MFYCSKKNSDIITTHEDLLNLFTIKIKSKILIKE